MIAHVAEAGEGRGRVVLRLDPTAPVSDVAIEAAIRIAQAFQSEIESVLVEDEQLFALAAFPFVEEISLLGETVGRMTAGNIGERLQLAGTALQRRVLTLARGAGVPLRSRRIRSDPVEALAAACAENGPWNVVALGEPFTYAHERMLQVLFEAVKGTTGIVVVGPNARRTSGPIVVVVEAIDRLPPLLRAARRLAGATPGATVVMLAAEDGETLHWLEGQARLVIGDAKEIRLVRALTSHGPLATAERLRQLESGFVIAEFGGRVVPAEGCLRALGAGLECPLFLVR